MHQQWKTNGKLVWKSHKIQDTLVICNLHGNSLAALTNIRHFHVPDDGPLSEPGTIRASF